MVIHVQYIRVTGRLSWHAANDKTGRAEVERACYGHTKVIDYVDDGTEFVAILETRGVSHGQAFRHANYQAERMPSFLWRAKVYDNPQEIEAKFGSFLLNA